MGNKNRKANSKSVIKANKPSTASRHSSKTKSGKITKRKPQSKVLATQLTSKLDAKTFKNSNLAKTLRDAHSPAKLQSPAESAKVFCLDRAKRILNNQKAAIVRYEQQQVEIEDTRKNLSSLFST
ncbi:hypothetical protein AYI68_g6908 [Smittium mucronatum]|uniref:Uncharacterized protein n=1 Tax=Smittium mucronatum TaxID=133383 RepID=A0A1R0GQ82_9FUNG|nr:hypothetical protein AYI68_g6908 [Smittium mucronatum]